MKEVGILFGQERTFPYALADRINALGADVTAKPVKVGGVGLESGRSYDLVLDRISQDVPFYRAVLKKWVADGTIVVNNPFWWSADDKFFNNVLAQRLGVPVPKTVLLPSHTQPPDTTSESFSNLEYPLQWQRIFDQVGFPAYFKPYSGGGWKSVYRVTNPEEFFGAYAHSGPQVMTLQEEIVFDVYYRCYVIGRTHVRVMPYDPRRMHHERYVHDPIWEDADLIDKVGRSCLTLAEVRKAHGKGAVFAVEASNETLARTTLGTWREGRRINLERAMALGDELGGHLVTGHVDGLARIIERKPDGESVRFVLESPAALARFIAEKGTVALDGVSLTVNDVTGARFGVNVIPYTLAHTTWEDRVPGDLLNLEVDLLARYVARLAETEGRVP
jgi:riboflavin synthase alpha subunit